MRGKASRSFLSLYQVTKVLRASTSVLPMNRIFRVDSFRTDWFDLLAVQGTLESFLQLQFKSISSLAPSFLYGPALSSVHDYWKNLLFIYLFLKPIVQWPLSFWNFVPCPSEYLLSWEINTLGGLDSVRRKLHLHSSQILQKYFL